MRYLVVAAAAVALSGCASSGPTGSQLTTASLAPSASRLIIYRTSPLGLALQPDYLVNGKKVGQSQPSGFVMCDLKPGTHSVAIANAASTSQAFGGGSDNVSVKLQPGKTTYLHAQPQMGLVLGVITLSEVTENQGKSDTASLHRIGGSCS